AVEPLPRGEGGVRVVGEVLAFPAADVAAILDTTVVSVKSALQRARARLAELALDDAQIAEPTAAGARALLDRYVAAFEDADAGALEQLLLEDATLEATPSRTWFAGRHTCVAFLRDHLLGSPGDWRRLPTGANGQPAAVAYTRDELGSYQPYGVCVLTVTDAGISRVSSFGDPGLVGLFGVSPVPLRSP